MRSDEGGALRALIVEDCDDDVLLLVDALNEGGFAVEFDVVDTAEALQTHLRSGGWDVVFCDHSLPVLDSPRALDIVRRHDRDLPFVIVSGSITDEVGSLQMHKGASDYIAKGHLSRLVPAVKRELREAATRRELQRARVALDRSRNYDQATGLGNADLMAARLDERMRQQEPFLLAVVELQRLRDVLKTVDPVLGRKILPTVGRRIGVSCDHILAARLGDDLFALMVDGGAGDADRLARAIVQEMSRPIRVADHVLVFPCHVGIGQFPDGAADADHLLEHACIALQWAKERSCDHALYQAHLDTEREARIDMERALYRALHNQEFVLHYQPQIDLASGRIVGVEALLRWNRPGHGLVPPGCFIPLLEETQLIVPVGEWVMRTACAANRRWQAAGFALRSAVNLSAIQFRQGGLPAMVDCALAESGLAPEYLELEITESIAMYNEAEITDTLAALKARGLSLAIDDFGTGYSSLGYLKRFPIDKLKIDRAFVRDIIRDRDDVAIVRAILAMAVGLELGVIAEGVETAEQAALLGEYGCHEAQGFHFGRPMPEQQLLDVLRAGTEPGRPGQTSKGEY